MSCVDGLIFKGERLIMPKTLRKKALDVIHRSHMGITKTLERAKGCFYWSGISKDIEHICSTCEPCLRESKSNKKSQRAKFKMSVRPGSPWPLIYLSSKASFFSLSPADSVDTL